MSDSRKKKKKKMLVFVFMQLADSQQIRLSSRSDATTLVIVCVHLRMSAQAITV